MKNKFTEYTDEELIGFLRKGDDSVMEYLMEKYKNLVRSKVKTMFILGGDDQDLIQEGMIGLYKAIRDYDSDKDASFYTFAELCVSRNVYTAVQRSNRKKHAPLNYYISLSETGKISGEAYDGGGEENHIHSLEHLAENDKNNPENILLDKEGLDDLELFIEKGLSPLERQSVELYITGMGMGEIAKILGKTEKAVDNALQRAKGKIRGFINARDSS